MLRGPFSEVQLHQQNQQLTCNSGYANSILVQMTVHQQTERHVQHRKNDDESATRSKEFRRGRYLNRVEFSQPLP